MARRNPRCRITCVQGRAGYVLPFVGTVICCGCGRPPPLLAGWPSLAAFAPLDPLSPSRPHHCGSLGGPASPLHAAVHPVPPPGPPLVSRPARCLSPPIDICNGLRRSVDRAVGVPARTMSGLRRPQSSPPRHSSCAGTVDVPIPPGLFRKLFRN